MWTGVARQLEKEMEKYFKIDFISVFRLTNGPLVLKLERNGKWVTLDFIHKNSPIDSNAAIEWFERGKKKKFVKPIVFPL